MYNVQKWFCSKIIINSLSLSTANPLLRSLLYHAGQIIFQNKSYHFLYLLQTLGLMLKCPRKAKRRPARTSEAWVQGPQYSWAHNVASLAQCHSHLTKLRSNFSIKILEVKTSICCHWYKPHRKQCLNYYSVQGCSFTGCESCL